MKRWQDFDGCAAWEEWQLLQGVSKQKKMGQNAMSSKCLPGLIWFNYVLITVHQSYFRMTVLCHVLLILPYRIACNLECSPSDTGQYSPVVNPPGSGGLLLKISAGINDSNRDLPWKKRDFYHLDSIDAVNWLQSLKNSGWREMWTDESQSSYSPWIGYNII